MIHPNGFEHTNFHTYANFFVVENIKNIHGKAILAYIKVMEMFLGRHSDEKKEAIPQKKGRQKQKKSLTDFSLRP